MRGAPPEVWCGCQCLDPAWSCSKDIGLSADGKVYGLADEAGFLELPNHTWSIDGESLTTARHRIWYAFKPAKEHTDETPLLVTFNGGPGASSQILFAANTHGLNADPAHPEAIGQTAAPWTDFAHVLYIDSPYVGFSYALPPADVTWSAEHDAALFLLATLAFIERHPALDRTEIVPVGESYGGFRALLMHRLADPSDGRVDLGYGNETLDEAIHAALDRRQSCDPASEASPPAPLISRVATIQGAVLGGSGLARTTTSVECQENGDIYDCRLPPGSTDQALCEIFRRIREPDVLAALTGVDVASIAWMGSEARAAAIPSLVDECAGDEDSLSAMFGSLPPSHAYFVGFSAAATTSSQWVGIPTTSFELASAALFFDVLRTGDIFLTDARYDLVVSTQELETQLLTHPDVSSVSFDHAPRPGIDRPGWVTISLFPSGPQNLPLVKTLRVPQYEAGHTVTLYDPEGFAADLRAWLQEPTEH